MASKVHVFSVTPYTVLMKTFGFGPTIHVLGKPEGKKYSTTVINESVCFKDFGENQKETFRVAPEDMLKDILADCDGQGVWGSEDEVPTPEDVASAEKRQREFYLKSIAEADSIWARSGDPARIPFHARIGARELNIEREWAKDTSSMEPCKGCKKLVSTGAVKCGHCGAILDWEGAIGLGLVTEEQVRFATKKGWISEAAAEEKPAPTKKAAK